MQFHNAGLVVHGRDGDDHGQDNGGDDGLHPWGEALGVQGLQEGGPQEEHGHFVEELGLAVQGGVEDEGEDADEDERDGHGVHAEDGAALADSAGRFEGVVDCRGALTNKVCLGWNAVQNSSPHSP